MKETRNGVPESGGPPARRNLWAHYQENSSWQKAAIIWERHRLTIIVAVLDFLVILYSLIGILRVGFENALGLFLIGIFVWFCLTYMVIRDNCGVEINNALIQPVAEAINDKWKYLKWYVNKYGRPWILRHRIVLTTPLLYTKFKVVSNKYVSNSVPVYGITVCTLTPSPSQPCRWFPIEATACWLSWPQRVPKNYPIFCLILTILILVHTKF